MDKKLELEIISGESLSRAELTIVLDLCSHAYEEDYLPFLKTFVNPIHILGKLGDRLVSHALWIPRWLQIDHGPLLRTAYVEAVATDEQVRGRGYASAVMLKLMEAIQDYDIGGLSPADTTLYARLGWEFWQGPLLTRTKIGLIHNPDEKVMILRLPKTPEIDLYAPISIEWREGEVW